MSTSTTSGALPLPEPKPIHWTLKFKSHKLTLFLTLDPTTPFSQIKSHLLHALHSTASLSELPSGEPLPTSPEEIEFAVPLDEKGDLSLGWREIEDLSGRLENGDGGDGESTGDNDFEDVPTARGKRKRGQKPNGTAAGGSTAAAGLVAKESPLGAGLKDWGTIAFRIRGVEEWDVVVPSYEDEIPEGEENGEMED